MGIQGGEGDKATVERAEAVTIQTTGLQGVAVRATVERAKAEATQITGIQGWRCDYGQGLINVQKQRHWNSSQEKHLTTS